MTASWFEFTSVFAAFWTFHHRPTFFSFLLNLFFTLFWIYEYHFSLFRRLRFHYLNTILIYLLFFSLDMRWFSISQVIFSARPWWLACHIIFSPLSLFFFIFLPDFEQITHEIHKKSSYKQWNNDYQQKNIHKAILLDALVVNQLIWFYTLSTNIQRYALLAFLTTF